MNGRKEVKIYVNLLEYFCSGPAHSLLAKFVQKMWPKGLTPFLAHPQMEIFSNNNKRADWPEHIPF